MRAAIGAIALARQSADQLGDASRVVAGGVDADRGRVEAPGQGLQAAADELRGAVVVGQVDAIEQVGPVAGVGLDGDGPAMTGQPAADLLAALLGASMFGLVGGDAGGAAGIDVHEQEATTGYVGVGGGVLGTLLEPVIDARQERGR
jgi:hypothetical protein